MMRWRLQVVRLLGGWIELELPAAAIVVGGERRSMAKGARGAASTDGVSASASVCPWRRVSSAVHFQSHCAMEFPSASGSVAAVGGGVVRLRRRGFLVSGKGPRTML